MKIFILKTAFFLLLKIRAEKDTPSHTKELFINFTKYILFFIILTVIELCIYDIYRKFETESQIES